MEDGKDDKVVLSENEFIGDDGNDGGGWNFTTENNPIMSSLWRGRGGSSRGRGRFGGFRRGSRSCYSSRNKKCYEITNWLCYCFAEFGKVKSMKGQPFKNIIESFHKGKIFSPKKFSSFYPEYQRFVLQLLFFNACEGSELNKISKDVLIHRIIPFINEIDIYVNQHALLGPLSRVKNLKTLPKRELSLLKNQYPVDDCIESMKLFANSSHENKPSKDQILDLLEATEYFKRSLMKKSKYPDFFTQEEKLIVFEILILIHQIFTVENPLKKRGIQRYQASRDYRTLLLSQFYERRPKWGYHYHESKKSVEAKIEKIKAKIIRNALITISLCFGEGDKVATMIEQRILTSRNNDDREKEPLIVLLCDLITNSFGMKKMGFDNSFPFCFKLLRIIQKLYSLGKFDSLSVTSKVRIIHVGIVLNSKLSEISMKRCEGIQSEHEGTDLLELLSGYFSSFRELHEANDPKNLEMNSRYWLPHDVSVITHLARMNLEMLESGSGNVNVEDHIGILRLLTPFLVQLVARDKVRSKITGYGYNPERFELKFFNGLEMFCTRFGTIQYNMKLRIVPKYFLRLYSYCEPSNFGQFNDMFLKSKNRTAMKTFTEKTEKEEALPSWTSDLTKSTTDEKQEKEELEKEEKEEEEEEEEEETRNNKELKFPSNEIRRNEYRDSALIILSRIIHQFNTGSTSTSPLVLFDNLTLMKLLKIDNNMMESKFFLNMLLKYLSLHRNAFLDIFSFDEKDSSSFVHRFLSIIETSSLRRFLKFDYKIREGKATKFRRRSGVDEFVYFNLPLRHFKTFLEGFYQLISDAANTGFLKRVKEVIGIISFLIEEEASENRKIPDEISMDLFVSPNEEEESSQQRQLRTFYNFNNLFRIFLEKRKDKPREFYYPESSSQDFEKLLKLPFLVSSNLQFFETQVIRPVILQEKNIFIEPLLYFISFLSFMDSDSVIRYSSSSYELIVSNLPKFLDRRYSSLFILMEFLIKKLWEGEVDDHVLSSFVIFFRDYLRITCYPFSESTQFRRKIHSSKLFDSYQPVRSKQGEIDLFGKNLKDKEPIFKVKDKQYELDGQNFPPKIFEDEEAGEEDISFSRTPILAAFKIHEESVFFNHRPIKFLSLFQKIFQKCFHSKEDIKKEEENEEETEGEIEEEEKIIMEVDKCLNTLMTCWNILETSNFLKFTSQEALKIILSIVNDLLLHSSSSRVMNYLRFDSDNNVWELLLNYTTIAMNKIFTTYGIERIWIELFSENWGLIDSIVSNLLKKGQGDYEPSLGSFLMTVLSIQMLSTDERKSINILMMLKRTVYSILKKSMEENSNESKFVETRFVPKNVGVAITYNFDEYDVFQKMGFLKSDDSTFLEMITRNILFNLVKIKMNDEDNSNEFNTFFLEYVLMDLELLENILKIVKKDKFIRIEVYYNILNKFLPHNMHIYSTSSKTEKKCENRSILDFLKIHKYNEKVQKLFSRCEEEATKIFKHVAEKNHDNHENLNVSDFFNLYKEKFELYDQKNKKDPTLKSMWKTENEFSFEKPVNNEPVEEMFPEVSFSSSSDFLTEDVPQDQVDSGYSNSYQSFGAGNDFGVFNFDDNASGNEQQQREQPQEYEQQQNTFDFGAFKFDEIKPASSENSEVEKKEEEVGEEAKKDDGKDFQFGLSDFYFGMGKFD